MDYKDYYKTLGLTKAATQDDIKKAYRSLAKQHHPDKNKGDKVSEAKFKEISEAYNVLSDPQKRQHYDNLGKNWQAGGNPQQEYSYRKDQNRPPQEEDFDFGGFGDVFGGFSDFFKKYFWDSDQVDRYDQTGQRITRGKDYETELSLSLEESYNATPQKVTVLDQVFRLTIKAGIEDGQTLKLKGKGGLSADQQTRGDLFITIRIKAHENFERDVNDLKCKLKIDLYTAVLGGEVPLKLLDGSSIAFKIPSGTDSGKLFRIKGKGMPVYGKENQFGDLYVEILVQVPKNLTEQEKALFEQLSKLKS